MLKIRKKSHLTKVENTQVKKSKAKKNKKASNLKPKFLGWLSTDEDEMLRRQDRAQGEKMRTVNAETKMPVRKSDIKNHSAAYYSDFIVQSASGSTYYIEIRSLSKPINSCDCPDYQTNQLGTCKHIEKVLLSLKKLGIRRFRAADLEGSSKTEIYLHPGKDLSENKVVLLLPKKYSSKSVSHQLIEPFFSKEGYLSGTVEISFFVLARAIAQAHKRATKKIRLSRHIEKFIITMQRKKEKGKSRERFLKAIEKGVESFDFLKYRLYPYQEKGMLHLAFQERAILADDMGLGKTIQAIAACELLRQDEKINKVLIVATASLKAEWEEQINKFVSLPLTIIQGSRTERVKQYQQSAFFYITNYEQIMRDVDDINRLLSPDVVILDEAQRIKNWRTKTAGAVKKLSSRYAFVLTGTPLENRIDDIYSIIQFLDPHLFGPLFRFNRDYYQLDEKGKPIGYKNLDELHRRLQPILLRRAKSDVENDLPDRTVNHFFIAMATEQRDRYEQYKLYVARLMSAAQKRPLRKEEYERLQRYLACMRMICDTPYILDQTCRVSPKINELKKILEELLVDKKTKIIIFSEWQRMLHLVREMLQKMSIGAAWHTGSVPQKKRRQEINRFKEDPNSRIFLSTDAGSVGLNLQVANVVINLDLPWNPAKLEQRIARSWRKFQTKTVQVINLVCEDSIEHRMLFLLEQKQQLANTVLHGNDELKEMKLPSGRTAFINRMNELMGEPASESTSKPISEKDSTTQTNQESNGEKDKNNDLIKNNAKAPIDIFQEEIVTRFDHQLDLLTVQKDSVGRETVFMVVKADNDEAQEKLQKSVDAAYQDLDQGSDKTKDRSTKDQAPEGTTAATIDQTSHQNSRPAIEMVDHDTFKLMQKLEKAGLITINSTVNSEANTLYRSQRLTKTAQKKEKVYLDKASKHLKQAERTLRMGDLLNEGGFIQEALQPYKNSLQSIIKAYAWIKGKVHMTGESTKPSSIADLQALFSEQHQWMQSVLNLSNALYDESKNEDKYDDDATIKIWSSTAQLAFQHVDETLKAAQLG